MNFVLASLPFAPLFLWRCGIFRSSTGGGSLSGSRRWWGCRSPCTWAQPPASGSLQKTRWTACCRSLHYTRLGEAESEIKEIHIEFQFPKILKEKIHSFSKKTCQALQRLAEQKDNFKKLLSKKTHWGGGVRLEQTLAYQQDSPRKKFT